MLASPAGIESTTSGSTHAHSDGHHAITAGQHTSVSAGQSFLVSARQAIRLFAYKAGMKLVAAAGKVQAQKDGIEVSALKDIQIVSVNGEVHITGRKKVVFIGGGSFTEWSADGITHGTAGSWQEHAAMHASKGPKSKAVVMPKMPRGYQAQYVLLDKKSGEPLANHPYKLKLPTGKTVAGISNAKGETMQVVHASAADVSLSVPEVPAAQEKSWHLAGGGSPSIRADYLEE